MGSIEVIEPDWEVPSRVRAATTTRKGGVSRGAWQSLNLADHVADDPMAVGENRRRLAAELSLPAEPAWLRQVHGCEVVGPESAGCDADACSTTEPGRVCVVMTADCLPVLFTDHRGSRVAAAHAGWRGLAAGVLEQTLAGFDCEPADIRVWLGPAIGPGAFEVGDEVRRAFLDHDPQAEAAFRPASPGHWLADLYLLARQRLSRGGVTAVWGGGFCTYNEPGRFYSFRRDGVTGRMASLIWLDEDS